jgi:hypothetical protein
MFSLYSKSNLRFTFPLEKFCLNKHFSLYLLASSCPAAEGEGTHLWALLCLSPCYSFYLQYISLCILLYHHYERGKLSPFTTNYL